MSQPVDPLTPIVVSATAMHEMYLSYVEAGFTEDQALKILIALMGEAMRANLRHERHEE